MIRWRQFQARSASDAEFRVWGTEVNAALAALGWLQTADTGQVNWTTATRPTLSNQKAGYEIWRANDALASQAPFYLKLTYGSCGGASRPRIWVQMGTGSDGAGNLTGASYESSCDGNAEDSQATDYVFIGHAGRFTMICNPAGKIASAISNLTFMIERTYALGQYNADGGVTVGQNPQLYAQRPIVNAHQWGMAARSGQYAATTLFTSQTGAGHWTEGAVVCPMFYNFANGFTAGEVGGACVIPRDAAVPGVVSLLSYPADQVRSFLIPALLTVSGIDGAGNGRWAFLWEP